MEKRFEDRLDEFLQRKKIEKSLNKINRVYSDYGKRLGMRYLKSQTIKEKLDVSTGLTLVCLGSLTGSKSLCNLGLKISTTGKEEE